MSNWAHNAAVLANKNHMKNDPTPIPVEQGKGAVGTRTNDKSSASAKAALLAHRSSASAPADTRLSESAAQESLNHSRDRALLAATKSMGSAKPAEKKPVMPPLEKRDSDLAQKRIAARQQESESRRNKIHMRKEMLTEHPPIRMEVEEKRHQDALHASALSLAKNVYAKNQQASGTTMAGNREANSDAKQQALQYVSLQGAAQKLASERLSRIKDPNDNFRNYYGYPDVSRSKSTRSTRVLNKVRHPRHRSSSDGEDDTTRSVLVRKQMALLQAQIAQVDESKVAQDRARLLAAAEKKVHAQMHKLDEEVFHDTGKMSPAMMSEWDAKARARLKEHNQTTARETAPDSAVDVGAGKLVDRGEVEDLAVERVGPTLRGIDAAVEKRKAEEAEQRAKEEEEKRVAREKKEIKKAEKEEKKRVHGQYSLLRPYESKLTWCR
jgi:Eisosome protein 1